MKKTNENTLEWVCVIDEKPIDGRDVLFRDKDRWIYLGNYEQSQWKDCCENIVENVVCWLDIFDLPLIPDGWIESVENYKALMKRLDLERGKQV